MRKYLIWGVAGLLGLIVVVGAPLAVTLYLIKDIKGSVPAEGRQTSTAATVKVTKDNVVALKPFVTNLADTDKPRYISVTIEIVIQNEKVKPDVEVKVPVIRDTIISLLSSRKSQEVTGDAGANTLKTEMITRLNSVLGQNTVQSVLITDLVVQH